MAPPTPLKNALYRILRPLVRLLVARGVRYPQVAEILKEIYVDTSRRHFRLGGKNLTNSRISLLTGLQRKDVKSVRARLDAAGPASADPGSGPLPRVLARWTGGPPYANAEGEPQTLARTGEDASFATLIAEVSRDIHPRTILDEFCRRGLASFDSERDEVTLLQASYLPSHDEAALLGYFGANLGDHAEAATLNLLAAPEAGPYFERAVHYNQLTTASLEELVVQARKLQGDVLAALNARALTLQKRDADDDAPKGRFRCGAYIYRTADETASEEH